MLCVCGICICLDTSAGPEPNYRAVCNCVGFVCQALQSAARETLRGMRPLCSAAWATMR